MKRKCNTDTDINADLDIDIDADLDIDIDIDDIPQEILLNFFTFAKYEYPWYGIHFIFNDLKMVCKKWNTIIESNEKTICGIFGIPYLHFSAAMNRDDEIVRLYLDENCPLRTPDKDGYSPACYAVGNHAIKSMHILEACYALYVDFIPIKELQIFAQNNSLSSAGKNYIIDDFTNAIESQSVKSLEEILLWDSDNDKDIILSKLFKYHMKLIKLKIIDNNRINRFAICIYKNFLADCLWDMSNTYDDILCECIKHDINFNTCDENGETFLHIAVDNPERLHIVKLLLTCKNIDINIYSRQLDTPLSIAILRENTEAIKALSENRNICYNQDCINTIIRLDRDDYLKLAISCGFTPTSDDLFFALRRGMKLLGKLDCLKILLDSVGIENRIISHQTPLSFSVGFNNAYLTNFLIQYGTDLNVKIKGYTLLEIAIRKNSKECLPILVNHLKNSIDKINEFTQYTPLSYAALLGHKGCIRILIQGGAQIDTKDGLGETALHHSTSENNMECIILLLDSGANINTQINSTNEKLDGYTPLHYASYYGDIDTVKLLLDRSADKTLTTKLGLTARDIALQSSYLGDFDIIKIILENRSDTTLPKRLGLEELDLEREEKYMHIFNLLQ
jgi:ankyrin repeat protein